MGEPATEGLRSPPSHTVCLINRQVEQGTLLCSMVVSRRASVLEIKRTNLLFLLLYRRRGAG